MGNCVNACLQRSVKHQEEHLETTTTTYPKQKQARREVVEGGSENIKASDGEGKCKDHESRNKKGDEGIVRVKIVLTKEELQWLMMQLKSDGEKRLENMLEEIERGRKKVVCDSGKGNGWKPSLESIMETPEYVLEMNPSVRL